MIIITLLHSQEITVPSYHLILSVPISNGPIKFWSACFFLIRIQKRWTQCDCLTYLLSLFRSLGSPSLSFSFSVYLLKQDHLSHRVSLIWGFAECPACALPTNRCLDSRGGGVAFHPEAANVCFSLFSSHSNQFLFTAWAHYIISIVNW